MLPELRLERDAYQVKVQLRKTSTSAKALTTVYYSQALAGPTNGSPRIQRLTQQLLTISTRRTRLDDSTNSKLPLPGQA